MKRTIQGRDYDTEADVERLRAPNDDALRRTACGQLYIHRAICQVREGRGWRNATAEEEIADLDETDRRLVRVLHTIQPVTAAEALDWMIWNILPKELCEVLAAREERKAGS